MQASTESNAIDRRPFKRRGRLVYSLLAVLVLVGLGPLVSGLWKVIRINREALVTATQEAQLMLAASTADKLAMGVEGVDAQLELVAQVLATEFVEADTRARERVRSLLDSVAGDRAIYVRFDTADLTLVGGELPKGAERFVDEAVEEGRHCFAENPMPLAAFEPSRPLLLDGPPRRSLLLTARPVALEPSGVGTLTALVDLDAIWKGASGNDLGGHLLYALDGTGAVILSSHAGLVQPGQDLRGRPLVDRFLSAHGRARETMPFTELRGGVEQAMLGSYAATSGEWGVFVEARLDQVYTPISSMVASTLISALAALVVALLAATLFSMSLSESINRLAALSRALAAGDYSLRVRVRSRNELGELAHAFNVMADEIEGHIARLQSAAAANEALFEGTILAMAEAIDAKDPYTRGHSVRVNRYSVTIAKYYGLSKDEIRDVHVASLLHDVGKIGIDDAILKKPGKLTRDEYEIIKTHAARGAAIMSRIPQMESILPGLRWHHERLDGTGYPDGLVGKQIPLLARIIAVADTFDAVTSDRSYQPTRTFAQGLELLESLRGELDPDVVGTFQRAYARGEIIPRPAVKPRETNEHALPLTPV